MSGTFKTFDPEAIAISNAVPYVTGAAIMARDFSIFAGSFSLPHLVTTFDAKRMIATLDEPEGVCLSNYDNLEEDQVTDIVRMCGSADFDCHDTVKATHLPHLLAGRQRIKDPYPAFSVITRTNGIRHIAKSDDVVGLDAAFPTPYGFRARRTNQHMTLANARAPQT